MKVLIVITGLGMGGAEHVVSNLADELIKMGHEVKIAYLTGDVLVAPKSSDIEIIPIGMNGSKDIPKAYIKLRRLVKDFRPDVVHSHMFHSNIISRLLRLSINIPKIINTAHSNNEGGKSRMLAYRLTDRLADISTNVSSEAVSEFIRKGAVKTGRMVNVTNGIDIRKFSFDRLARGKVRAELSIKNEKVLLAVGRLDIQKDYPNLLSALHLLSKSRKDFKLFIVGDGPLKDDFNQRIEELNLTDTIQFLGIRRDIPSLMSAADVFVLSSAWEGFGLVVAEAMACERLVVATDCGGVKEVIGETDFLVPPKNCQALADALGQALELSVNERLKLGSKARKRVIQHYSLDSAIKKWLYLYSASTGDLEELILNV